MTNDLPPELESFVAELRQVRAPRPSFKKDILTRARELGVPRRSWVPSWRLLVTGLDESRLNNLQLIYPRRLMPCNALAGATATAPR